MFSAYTSYLSPRQEEYLSLSVGQKSRFLESVPFQLLFHNKNTVSQSEGIFRMRLEIKEILLSLNRFITILFVGINTKNTNYGSCNHWDTIEHFLFSMWRLLWEERNNDYKVISRMIMTFYQGCMTVLNCTETRTGR